MKRVRGRDPSFIAWLRTFIISMSFVRQLSVNLPSRDILLFGSRSEWVAAQKYRSYHTAKRKRLFEK